MTYYDFQVEVVRAELDRKLGQWKSRDLVSGRDVVDALLDIRQLLIGGSK